VASAIIFADTIFKEKVFACTASYGKPLTAISPIDGTSTTVTGTGRTINSKILSWLDRHLTFRIIQSEQTTKRPLQLLSVRLNSGTDQPKVESGTQSTPWPSWKPSRLTGFRRLVRYAVRSLQRLGYTRTALFIATLTAVRQRCVSAEPYGRGLVTCLRVKDGNAFALEGGTLVHNCYDEVRYACMSRPYLKVVPKYVPKEDTWLRVKDEDEEESWRTA
jgi:hypothetical protein